MRVKVYLAGPEVFLPNAAEIQKLKAELARAAGFTPLVPGDLEIPPAPTKHQRGLAIYAVDEGMMLAADMIIANLTPFRGISADVGTVFELGFMCGHGKHVYAYTNTARSYYERILHDHYGGNAALRPDGRMAGPDGNSIEDFDMADNLMLDGGVLRREGRLVQREVPEADRLTDLQAFKECLAIAAKQHLA
ncbi:nucleoside 2-deoxyribosyltransferase (plasmid) [Ensifer sp. PDNC004]|uniref:nucleoside 2-deoxyribosyltransferase n=1 Tax=Ensifer sp. PDNC004 TaxID=2811423 RepID=UPI001966A944|nr:nucleoside 2-deoxyribosyltransferase [Ensifer sp. PDNC004]QRY65547.1 nucleoside 2-deoxyribosyltransferase [Ensifer sp. PDNC004]